MYENKVWTLIDLLDDQQAILNEMLRPPWGSLGVGAANTGGVVNIFFN